MKEALGVAEAAARWCRPGTFAQDVLRFALPYRAQDVSYAAPPPNRVFAGTRP
jgi:hypothetical protein